MRLFYWFSYIIRTTFIENRWDFPAIHTFRLTFWIINSKQTKQFSQTKSISVLFMCTHQMSEIEIRLKIIFFSDYTTEDCQQSICQRISGLRSRRMVINLNLIFASNSHFENFDKLQHFHEFFTKICLTIFLVKSKLNFWTKNEEFEQCEIQSKNWIFISV